MTDPKRKPGRPPSADGPRADHIVTLSADERAEMVRQRSALRAVLGPEPRRDPPRNEVLGSEALSQHFKSPEEAEASLQKHSFDFVLTDWNLGMSTGERVARKAIELKVPVRIYSGRGCPKTHPDFTSIWMGKGGADFHPTLEALLDRIRS